MDGLNTYVISHAVRQQGIKVALSGLGGDEVFGGYSSFRDVPRVAKMARATAWVPKPVRQAATRFLYRSGNQLQRRKAYELAGNCGTLTDAYFRRRRLLSDAELQGLGLDFEALGLENGYLPPEAVPVTDTWATDPIATVGMLESRFYMGNMLLRDSDVFGMAHGLEIRVPFLDRPLVDYAYRLPGTIRLPSGAPGKHLIREALADLLPADLLRLRKQGFSLSQEDWIAGTAAGAVRESYRGGPEFRVGRSGGSDRGVGGLPGGPTRRDLVARLGSWCARCVADCLAEVSNLGRVEEISLSLAHCQDCWLSGSMVGEMFLTVHTQTLRSETTVTHSG